MLKLPHRTMVLVLLLLAVGHTAASAAGTARASEPVDVPEALVTMVPSDFVSAFTTQVENMRVQEFIPKGQTLQNWTRMITIQVHRKIIDPVEFGRAVGARFTTVCPQTQVYRDAQAPIDELPAARFFFRVPACAATTAESNLMLYIRGRTSTYAILYAWRPRPPTKQEFTEANAVLNAIRVCAAPDACGKAIGENPAADRAFVTQREMWQRTMTAARGALADTRPADAEALLKDALVEAQRQQPGHEAALETYAALEALYRSQQREREAAEIARLADDLRRTGVMPVSGPARP